jgi:hypothetical protein
MNVRMRLQIFVCLGVCQLPAEYLVFKKEGTTITALNNEEEHAKLYPILMKYQFPFNTNNRNIMQDEERQACLHDEAQFILH